MNEEVKKNLCSVAKRKFKALNSKKELSKAEMTKAVLYQYLISNQCNEDKKKKKKHSDFEAINRLRKKLFV